MSWWWFCYSKCIDKLNLFVFYEYYLLTMLFRLRLLIILLSFYSAQGLFTHYSRIYKNSVRLILRKKFLKDCLSNNPVPRLLNFRTFRTGVSITTLWESSNLISWNVNIIKMSVKFYSKISIPSHLSITIFFQLFF